MKDSNRCSEDFALKQPGAICVLIYTLIQSTLTVLGGTGVFVVAVASEAPEGVEIEGSSGILPLLSRTLKRQTEREHERKHKCTTNY